MYIATDGVFDQENNDNKFYGKKGFVDFVSSHNKLDYQAQHQLLVKSIDDFKGTKAQNDDITVVGLKLKPKI
jgi:serine phosphatase RsbU (regulator of sigma subunit)